MNKPGSTGFFLFPIDEENPGARIPHDPTRAYPLANFANFTDPRTFAQLKTRVGAGALAIVGLWPEEGVVKKFEMIVGGETCLFVKKSGLVAAGTIIHSERSRQLAEQFFGRGPAGTHECLILLAGVEQLAMPIDSLYQALGRKVRTPFKGFTTMSAEQIRKIEEKFGSFFGFLEAAKAKA
jgi:hypothetical protein